MSFKSRTHSGHLYIHPLPLSIGCMQWPDFRCILRWTQWSTKRYVFYLCSSRWSSSWSMSMCVCWRCACCLIMRMCLFLISECGSALWTTGRCHTHPLNLVGHQVMDMMNGNGLSGGHGEHHGTWRDVVLYPVAVRSRISVCLCGCDVMECECLFTGRCMCMLLSLREDRMPMTRDFYHGKSLLVSTSLRHALTIRQNHTWSLCTLYTTFHLDNRNGLENQL